jgi:HlyD family secretion protein
MSVRRSIIVLSLLVLVLPAFLFTTQASQQRQQNPPRNLQLYTARRGDIDVSISALGDIEPDQTASVSFTSGGRVSDVMVQEGDFVKTGDPLIRLEGSNQQLAYQQAQLTLESANVNLKDVLDGPDEDDIKIAEANVTAAQGAYSAVANAVNSDQIHAAELAYQQAQDAYKNANVARTVAGGDSQEAINLLDAQIGQASFNQEIARLQLESLKTANGPQKSAAGAAVAAAKAKLEQVKAGPTQAQIDAAKVQVMQAQTALDQAAQNLSKLTVTAPFDGLVSKVDVEKGALIGPGMQVVELTDIEPMHLTVQVDEVDIRQVRPQMPAIVKLDAVPGLQLPATIERISLVGTNDNGIISYDVEVTPTEKDSRVRVGMTAEADIITQSAKSVIIVPNQYLHIDRANNTATVNIVGPNNTLTQRQVTLGLQDANNSEIQSGLTEGEVIAFDLNASGAS